MLLGDLGAEIIKVENPDGGDESRNWGPPFMNGYGSTGPYSSRAGYDVIAASVGGLLGITGPENGDPCKPGVALTDLATGLYAHGAVMAALLQRFKTGLGQKIECDLLSTQVSLLANIGSNYLNANKEAQRWGTAHESIVPYQSFRTKDGYITVGAGSNKQFKVLCEIFGCEELVTDPLYFTNENRVKNRRPLITRLSDIFSNFSNEECLHKLEGSGIPYGPVNSMKEVFDDPQVLHNQMIIEMDHAKAGRIKMTGPAVKFSDSINEGRTPPPGLGDHTDFILSNILSYSKDEIGNLRNMKVIL